MNLIKLIFFFNNRFMESFKINVYNIRLEQRTVNSVHFIMYSPIRLELGSHTKEN